MPCPFPFKSPFPRRRRSTALPHNRRQARPDHGTPPEWPDQTGRTFWQKFTRRSIGHRILGQTFGSLKAHTALTPPADARELADLRLGTAAERPPARVGLNRDEYPL